MSRRPYAPQPHSSVGPTKSGKTKKAEGVSKERWLAALSFLLANADRRFGDVAWCTDAQGTEDVVWAHKALLYARSSAGVLHRYLQGYKSPLPPGNQSVTSLVSLHAQWNSSTSSHQQSASSLRSASPDPSLMSVATIQKPMQLDITDRTLLDPLLQFIYTGKGQMDAFAFLFEEAHLQDALLKDPVNRLSQDLVFMWRSKLYADILIKLVPGEIPLGGEEQEQPQQESETFACHRAILATVPYFDAILLGSYTDKDSRVLTLPSPPFTPAALHFTLGYLYSGFLDFSQRSFDLSTAFAIWHSATYLSIDALREEIECRIEDMCFGPKPDPLRCARLFQWTLLPDVNCLMLQQRSKSVMLDRFGEAWRIEIGSLDQPIQQRLVSEKCLTVTPENAIEAIRGVMTIRSKLETVTQVWARHVLAMTEPVELRAAKLLVSDTAAAATSAPFVELIEGRSFSRDVLEHALQLLASHLDEKSAAVAYQAVVGHVLLREEGIQVDARVCVEDCRQAILKYLKARWMGTKAASGFNELDSWALKEIADELDMKPQDLIAVEEPPPLAATRTGLRPVRKSVASNDGEPPLRTSILNRNAASAVSKNPNTRINAPKAPAISATPRSRPLRPTQTTSNTNSPESAKSSSGLASSSATSSVTSASNTRTLRMSQSSRSSAASTSTAETSSEEMHTGSTTPKFGKPAAPRASSAAPRASSASASGRRSAEPPSTASRASSRTSTRRAAAPPPASASASQRTRTISQDGGASTRSSVRSTAASLARERATAAAAAASRPPRSPSAASSRSLASRRAAPPPPLPSQPRTTKSSVASSTRSVARSAATQESSRKKSDAPATPSAKFPSSSSSAASTRSMSSASMRSAPSASTARGTPVRGRTTSAKSSLSTQSRATKAPFGTSLHCGIRCVVSFTNGQKSTGSVLYLGPVPELGKSNYVGLELDEPEEVTAEDLEWSNGEIDGVKYFSQSRKRRGQVAGVFVKPPQVMYLF